MYRVFMRRLFVFAIGSCGGLIQAQAFAETCAKEYAKSIPYAKDYIDNHARISLHDTVNLRYDCKTFLSESIGGIRAKFYGVDAELIEARVAANSGKTSSRLSFSALVLGYEIAHEDRALGEVYRKTFRSDHDLDLAKDTVLQVGPLTVPVRVGIQGTGALAVTAGLRNLGAAVTAIPSAKANAYVLAGVDVKIIKGSARGDLLLVDGQLGNSLSVYFNPEGDTPTIDVGAASDLTFSAFEGTVTASVQMPEGGSKPKTHKVELFRWEGVKQDVRLFEHSEKIAALPSYN